MRIEVRGQISQAEYHKIAPARIDQQPASRVGAGTQRLERRADAHGWAGVQNLAIQVAQSKQHTPSFLVGSGICVLYARSGHF